MDKKDFYQKLIHRYVTGRATEAELEAFFALMESGEADEELRAYLEQDVPAEKQKRRWWPAVAIAASVLIAIGFYFSQQQPAPQVAIQKPIVPGTNKAILTLANGQQISLNDAQNGQLAAHITKNGDQLVYETSEELAYHTITTPRGGQWPELVLPDGTKVMLDAASSIRYPVAFKGRERLVEVTGQVYFEVKHDPKHPFKVKAGGQTIEDIGTEFNINAYNDEPQVNTTLVEGIVAVNGLRLEPGQQTDGTKIRTVNVEDVVAWKNGQTSFEGEGLPEIMRQVSRWYDVDIKYDGEVPKRKFTGGISRKAQLKDLLTILAFQDIHYELKGRTLIVKTK